MKPGELVGENNFYIIKEITDDSVVLLKDNDEIEVSKELVKLFSTTDVFESKISTKSNLSNLIQDNKFTPIIVNYNKQIKVEDVKVRLAGLYANEHGRLLSKQSYLEEVDKAAKALIKGEERTLKGYCFGSDEFGRFKFYEVLEDGSKQIRLVDPRTTNWAVIKNTKYIV